jgi:hypothetical protein
MAFWRLGVITYYVTMPLAGIGMDYIVKSLKQKPLINIVNSKTIFSLLYLAHIIGSIAYVYSSLGTLSPPGISTYLHQVHLKPVSEMTAI